MAYAVYRLKGMYNYLTSTLYVKTRHLTKPSKKIDATYYKKGWDVRNRINTREVIILSLELLEEHTVEDDISIAVESLVDKAAKARERAVKNRDYLTVFHHYLQARGYLKKAKRKLKRLEFKESSNLDYKSFKRLLKTLDNYMFDSARRKMKVIKNNR